MRMSTRFLATAVALALAACGGSGAFQLTSEDNNPERLDAAFKKIGPARTGPVNATGRPLAVLVARTAPTRTIIAFDLDGKKELWRAQADVKSRVLVGRSFVGPKMRGGATPCASSSRKTPGRTSSWLRFCSLSPMWRCVA